MTEISSSLCLMINAAFLRLQKPSAKIEPLFPERFVIGLFASEQMLNMPFLMPASSAFPAKKLMFVLFVNVILAEPNGSDSAVTVVSVIPDVKTLFPILVLN